MLATILKRTSSPVFSCEQIKHFFGGSFYSSIRADMFYKIGLFKNFGKLTGKGLCRSFFLIKLYTIKPIFFGSFQSSIRSDMFYKMYTIKPATLLKRDFGSDVLLRILRNCFRHLFYRTPFFYLLYLSSELKYNLMHHFKL